MPLPRKSLKNRCSEIEFEGIQSQDIYIMSIHPKKQINYEIKESSLTANITITYTGNIIKSKSSHLDMPIHSVTTIH